MESSVGIGSGPDHLNTGDGSKYLTWGEKEQNCPRIFNRMTMNFKAFWKKF